MLTEFLGIADLREIILSHFAGFSSDFAYFPCGIPINKLSVHKMIGTSMI
jgi:hypothetical protein